MNNSQNSFWRGPLSPLVHLANNWISLIGVILVTTASVFFFFLGLFLIPLGIFIRNRKEKASGIYPASFPPLNWGNRDLRRLVMFLAVTTMVNIIIASQVTYAAITYM